jgi:hypothetical protein
MSLVATALLCALAAPAVDVGVDAGVGVAVTGESRSDAVFSGAIGPEMHLRLHLDDVFIESSTDAAFGVLGVFLADPSAQQPPGIYGAGGIGYNTSLSSSLVVGYGINTGPWTFAAGAGPWAGLLPYSCGDCFDVEPAFGGALVARVSYRPIPVFAFELVTEIVGAVPLVFRPSARLQATYVFGDAPR